MFKHIIVALDGSECSHEALALAVGLAKEQGARCTLCTVVDIVRAASSMTFASGDIVNQWVETLNQDAREIIAEASKKYADSGVRLESVVVEGYPSDAIVDIAKKNGADLLVMGSHGRSGLRRLFIGSVAEAVVRTAPVPILIVRGAS